MAFSGACLRAAALALLILDAARPACSQVYLLKELVPPPQTLQVLQAFYVFGAGEAGVPPSSPPPLVSFEGIVSSEDGVFSGSGVQVGLIYEQHFSQLMASGKGICTSSGTLPGVEPRLEVPMDGNIGRLDPTKLGGGMWYLVCVNCGEQPQLTRPAPWRFSGRVVVRNPYGYLPGSEFHTIRLYGWLAVAYAALVVSWAAAMLKWYTETVPIHSCVLVVLGLCLAQMATQWWALSSLNESGDCVAFWSALGGALSVAKMSICYGLLVVMSVGWGVTTEAFDELGARARFLVASMVFPPAIYLAECVLSYRHKQRFAGHFMYASVAVEIFINAVALRWILDQLSETVGRMEERGMRDSAALFGRIRRALAVSGMLGFTPLLAYIADIAQRERLEMWKVQSLLQEGGVGLTFLGAVVWLMCLISPNSAGLQNEFFAVSVEEEGTKAESQPVIWTDEDVEEQEEYGDHGFVPTTLGLPAARRDGGGYE